MRAGPADGLSKDRMRCSSCPPPVQEWAETRERSSGFARTIYHPSSKDGNAYLLPYIGVTPQEMLKYKMCF